MISQHASKHGVAVIARFLDDTRIAHEVLEHAPTYSMLDEAQAVGDVTTREQAE